MKKAIIIDDNPEIGRMVSRMLEAEGFASVVLTSGEDILDHLRAEAADLVITDILMPRVEGIEIIMSIRSDFPNLPIIAMSGGGHSIGKDVLRSARQLGAAAILTKPFTRQDLVAAIAEALPDPAA